MLYTIIVLGILNVCLIWNLQKIIEIYLQLKPYNISLIQISTIIIRFRLYIFHNYLYKFIFK